MAPRERVTYTETYRKGEAKIRASLLPDTLPHFTPGTTLVGMELRKAGTVEIDGETFEFQDLHILVRPPKEAKP
jgi:hypothetical protein